MIKAMVAHKNDPHIIELDDPRVGQATTPQPEPAPALPPAASRPAASTADPVPTKSLVKQLKERLRVVEREIKVRKSLEDERCQINRLLAAAKLEKNNVRRMRAVG